MDLPEDHLRGLDLWCQKEKISRAEAVRRAVRAALASRGSDPRKEAFGAWAHKKVDGRKFIEALRAEWDA